MSASTPERNCSCDWLRDGECPVHGEQARREDASSVLDAMADAVLVSLGLVPVRVEEPAGEPEERERAAYDAGEADERRHTEFYGRVAQSANAETEALREADQIVAFKLELLDEIADGHYSTLDLSSAEANVIATHLRERDEALARVAGLEAREAALRDALDAAKDLYERVEMDESVGICLSDRVPSMRLGAALAALADSGEAGS